MDCLEEAGWSYDPTSDSIESVAYNNPVLMMIPFAMFLSPIAILQLVLPGESSLFGFILTLGGVTGVSFLISYAVTVNGTVRRISLTDLSQTVMKRHKTTLVNTKINRLESKEDFIHENLAVILYEHSVTVTGPGAMDARSTFEVRLVKKEYTKGNRFFGASTLHPDLECHSPYMAFNYREDPAHDLQRVLILNAGSQEKGMELRDKFHDFFIEGGWKKLSPNSPVEPDVENPTLSNQAFW